MNENSGPQTYRDLAPQARRGLQIAVTGAVLVGASLFCNQTLGPSMTWSDDDARGYADAAARFHDLQHTASHAEPSSHHAHPHSDKGLVTDNHVAAAKQDYEQRRSRFESALNRGRVMESILRWSGIALTLVGLLQFLRHREPDG